MDFYGGIEWDHGLWSLWTIFENRLMEVGLAHNH